MLVDDPLREQLREEIKQRLQGLVLVIGKFQILCWVSCACSDDMNRDHKVLYVYEATSTAAENGGGSSLDVHFKVNPELLKKLARESREQLQNPNLRSGKALPEQVAAAAAAMNSNLNAGPNAMINGQPVGQT